MKRNRLVVPEHYTASLQEVLATSLREETLHTREGKRAIAKIAQHVEALQKGLTVERDAFLAKQYLAQPELRQAYLLYYTTTNFLKPMAPLHELFLQKELPDKLTVLDLGAGTGAASLGLLHFLRMRSYGGTVELHLADAVQKNLDDASTLITTFARSLPFTTVCKIHHYDITKMHLPFSQKIDLIIMMNTINELDEAHDDALLKWLALQLSPDGSLLAIEPAARPASRRALRFRDEAARTEWTVYAPCTRQSFCPALENENNWCHSEEPWERPGFIEAIDDLTGTLRLSLKYTYFLLNRNGDTLSRRLQKNSLSRVVSERFDEKGRTRAFLCDESGRYEHVMNKRDRNSSNQQMQEIERYDVVQITGLEPREHDKKVSEASQVSIVLPH